MSLFTDESISTIEDLLQYESSILDLASSEGIDLSSKLRLAHKQIQTELVRFFEQESYEEIDTPEARRALVDRVVVTDPLRHWHITLALSLIFGDAAGSHLSERYIAKQREYSSLSVRAARTVAECGVGLANRPVRRAAPPLIEAIEGTLGPAIFYVRVSWVDSDIEGEASETRTWESTEGSGLRITVHEAPPSVTGWNVYLGTSVEQTLRQNDQPLAISGEWVHTGGDLADGALATSGQDPDFFLRKRQILKRG